MRQTLPEVSRQTVYDVLNALTGVGLVRRIQPSGSVARYETRVGDNHHHVVCRSCGVIADVDRAVGESPCLTPLSDDLPARRVRPRRDRSHLLGRVPWMFGCSIFVITTAITARFTTPGRKNCALQPPD